MAQQEGLFLNPFIVKFDRLDHVTLTAITVRMKNKRF